MFKTKKKTMTLISPATGTALALDEIEDREFAEKLVGDGVILVPVEGDFRCPAGGRISGVADGLHAYTLETDDGVDILIHIGIGTVDLMGEGFRPAVGAGDMVKAGDPLCRVNLELIKSRGYSVYTPIMICDMEKVTDFTPIYGEMIGGADALMEYTVKRSDR